MDCREDLRSATVRKLFNSNFKKPKTKLQPRSLEYLTKALNISIMECVMRAGRQAHIEGSTIVTLDTMQKIIPQMVMDL